MNVPMADSEGKGKEQQSDDHYANDETDLQSEHNAEGEDGKAMDEVTKEAETLQGMLYWKICILIVTCQRYST